MHPTVGGVWIGGSLGLAGHQPSWKTASSKLTERLCFKKIRQTHRRKYPSPPLSSVHMGTHMQTPYMFIAMHTK